MSDKHKSDLSDNASILVSHAGKQYVHRFVQGLLANGWGILFCTPIWFQRLPSWFRLVPPSIRRKLTSELKKRLFTFHGNIELITSPIMALQKEVAERIPRGRGVNGAQLKLEKQQDRFAARLVAKHKPKIVVGYEIASKRTFAEARSRRIITVLDLAQIHYQDIIEIAGRYPPMDYILKNPYLEEINTRKQSEYESADFIITLSSYARQSLLKRGFPADKVYEVNLGFDVNLFTPKRQYENREELRLLICGTDMIRKGLGLLIQVLKTLEHQGLKLKLTVVGPPGEINKVIKQYGQPASVSILGFLTHENLVKQYQDADLFVFPSYLDSWAMTVLEAMACGTPVIVTENTGSKEAVQKGGGIVIPAGNALALEDTIKSLYNNRSTLETLGKKAREVAVEYT
ncbi:MAG TPA: glycosyltransferase family 4 protein, partial [Cyclobacteriaceae bacterium]|nr:glycosyltransferase family 4 protein [Cyclobacteriaceae bacterium]